MTCSRTSHHSPSRPQLYPHLRIRSSVIPLYLPMPCVRVIIKCSIHRVQHIRNTAQHMPNTAHHTPNTAQHTPNTAQHTQNTAQHTPNTAQYIPTTVHHTPNTAQHTPNTAQHTPNTAQYTPNTVQHTPNTAEYTPNTAYAEYSIHCLLHTLHTVSSQDRLSPAPSQYLSSQWTLLYAILYISAIMS